MSSAATDSIDESDTGAMWIGMWGAGGAAFLLATSVWRLAPLAWEPVVGDPGMNTFQWALYIGFAAFNAWAEGYRGFQLKMSPHVASRALYLSRNPTPLRVLLAPLFCISLFGAKRRRLVTRYAILLVIICLIVAVRMLAQPWRGIIDIGVVIGLSWGAATILWSYYRLVSGDADPVDPDIPGYDFEPSAERN